MSATPNISTQSLIMFLKSMLGGGAGDSKDNQRGRAALLAMGLTGFFPDVHPALPCLPLWLFWLSNR